MIEQEELIHRLVESTTDWHAAGLLKLDAIIDSDVETVKLGTDEDSVELTGEALRGFRAGLAVARGFFATLPFQATPTDGPSKFADQAERMEQDRKDSVESLEDQQDVPALSRPEGFDHGV